MNCSSFSTLASVVFVSMIDNNRPIEAIKILRLIHHARSTYTMGLREAKEIIDALRAGRGEITIQQRPGESDAEFRVHVMLLSHVFSQDAPVTITRITL